MAFMHIYSSSTTTIQVQEGYNSEKNYCLKVLLVVAFPFLDSAHASQHNLLILLSVKSARKHKELSDEACVAVCSVITYKNAWRAPYVRMVGTA